MSEAESPFPSESPLGGALPSVTATDPDEVRAMVASARAAQRAWEALDVADRARRVARLKARVLSRAEEIADLVRRECGKPFEEALLGEVLPTADLVDFWSASIAELMAPMPVELDGLSFPGKVGKTLRAPRGVVGLITPWNYPFAIPLRTIVPALMAGNAVILKPSEITPRVGALVASVLDGVVPKDLFQIAQGGAAVGEALVAAGADLLVFTGSVATGKRIAALAAETLTPTSLELGGKDAAIVLADASLERAARGVVWAAFTNAGQNCAAVERVYVEKSIAKAFTERVVALTKELAPKRDTGMLTTQRQAERVKEHVDAAVAAGAEILVGGPPSDGDLRVFPPTVVRVEDEATPLLQDETFGPVLPIVTVESAADAVERTNRSRYALTTSLWTRDLERARSLASALRSGIVTINNHGFTAAIPEAPWTGAGDSGYGVTSSPHALAELTRPRFVLEDTRRAKQELWWYPYGGSLRAVGLAMARVRGGAGIFGRIAALLSLLVVLPKRLLGK